VSEEEICEKCGQKKVYSVCGGFWYCNNCDLYMGSEKDEDMPSGAIDKIFNIEIRTIETLPKNEAMLVSITSDKENRKVLDKILITDIGEV